VETYPHNPLVGLAWVASTVLGAAVIVSLLLVVLVRLDQEAEPVPAEDAHLAALFTNEAQIMEGPSLIAPGRVDLNVVNTTVSPRELVVCYFTDQSEWMREQFRLGPGENTAVASGGLMQVGQLIATVAADPGSDITTQLTMANGFYIFDWVDRGDSTKAGRVWRIGAVEVTA
jgi:hypothetical protein